MPEPALEPALEPVSPGFQILGSNLQNIEKTRLRVPGALRGLAEASLRASGHRRSLEKTKLRASEPR